jgi:hypothetical protein
MTSSPSLSHLQVRHWALVVAAAAVALAGGWPGAGGVVLGGAAMGASVLAYAGAVRLLLRRPRPRLAIGLLFVKLLAFLGLGWLAFASGREHRPDPIGFAVGIMCFPAAAVWEAMRTRGS